VKVTNELGISLPLAVWLLTDDYDYVTGVENYYSVTTLQKPLRQILLPGRIPYEEQRSDVADYIARKLGHAIHDSMERSWTTDQYKRSLKLLGHPDSVIEQIAVNPTDEERRASNSMIPVYLEQRMFRKITVDGKTYTIGGKYDMVADGIIQDTKSTSAWAYTVGSIGIARCPGSSRTMVRSISSSPTGPRPCSRAQAIPRSGSRPSSCRCCPCRRPRIG
jgi:hypothetical protein